MILCLSFIICSGYSASVSSSTQAVFGTDSTSDGPVTICSDSLVYDQQKQMLTYEGNVLVMQIKSASILCHHSETEDENKTTGQSFSLYVDSSNKSYPILQQKEMDKAKSICQQHQQCRFLSGQKLQVFLEDNKIQKVLLTVKKVEDHITKFYGLSPAKDSKSKPETTFAEGKKMEFLPQKQKMIVTGDAHIVKQGNIFKGQQIVYDTKTKIVRVPSNSGERASMIINSDGTLSTGGKNSDRKE